MKGMCCDSACRDILAENEISQTKVGVDYYCYYYHHHCHQGLG